MYVLKFDMCVLSDMFLGWFYINLPAQTVPFQGNFRLTFLDLDLKFSEYGFRMANCKRLKFKFYNSSFSEITLFSVKFIKYHWFSLKLIFFSDLNFRATEGCVRSFHCCSESTQTRVVSRGETKIRQVSLQKTICQDNNRA